VQKKVRSAAFNIDARVYKNVLKAAMRTYFYQRSGFAKKPPYAEACWSDNAAYLGPNQDREAHDVMDRNNRAKVRDLSGGWFDAGDTNKYVTFAAQPVHQLLTAFEENDQAFTDDFNIPESGNGIPDVIAGGPSGRGVVRIYSGRDGRAESVPERSPEDVAERRSEQRCEIAQCGEAHDVFTDHVESPSGGNRRSRGAPRTRWRG